MRALIHLISSLWPALSPVLHRLAPFQVVGRKLEEVHHRRRLFLPPQIPAALREVVWECIHVDPKRR